jgi:hypothetical protein
MIKILTVTLSSISLLASQAMAQGLCGAECATKPPCTVIDFIIQHTYALMAFVIILILNLTKSRRIPGSASFAPFFIALSHALLKWVWFCRSAGMGHLEEMTLKCLEIVAVGCIFTVLLIAVDIAQCFINKPHRKNNEQ